jgi:hypothetical protein
MNLRERWHRTHIKFGVISVLLDKPERSRRRAKEPGCSCSSMRFCSVISTRTPVKERGLFTIHMTVVARVHPANGIVREKNAILLGEDIRPLKNAVHSQANACPVLRVNNGGTDARGDLLRSYALKVGESCVPDDNTIVNTPFPRRSAPRKGKGSAQPLENLLTFLGANPRKPFHLPPFSDLIMRREKQGRLAAASGIGETKMPLRNTAPSLRWLRTSPFICRPSRIACSSRATMRQSLSGPCRTCQLFPRMS